MEYLLLWIGLAVAAGVIASSKNRSFFGYFILALFLPLIGVIIALGITRRETHQTARAAAPASSSAVDPRPTRKCVACAELILAEATKCKHCGEIQPAAVASAPMNWDKIDETERSLDQRRRR